MIVQTDFPFYPAFDSTNLSEAIAWWGPPDVPWVRANIVTDTLGHTVDSMGKSDALTGGADRELLRALRASADVVVMGGATLRAEPLSVPRDRPVVVVSRSANIPSASIERAESGITVLHDKSIDAPRGTTSIMLARFSGSSIVSAVKRMGHRRIVVEGGVTLLHALVKSSSITEWCQTISPHLITDPTSVTVPDVHGDVIHLAHDSAGFRYVRRAINGAPAR